MDTNQNQTETVGFSKEQILLLKAEIKKLSAEQKSIKPQRKTYHYKGERTIPAGTAQWKHYTNRYELRHMYLAYAIMRGKTLTETEGKNYTPPNQFKIDEILKKYGKAVCSNS